MIEGFKLKVSALELKKHCNTRSAYHARRTQEKRQELPRLRESLEAIKRGGMTAAASLTNMSTGYNMNAVDVVKSLEKDITEHAHRAVAFKFFADHLFDDDYILVEDDLTRLEILGRGRGASWMNELVGGALVNPLSEEENA